MVQTNKSERILGHDKKHQQPVAKGMCPAQKHRLKGAMGPQEWPCDQ